MENIDRTALEEILASTDYSVTLQIPDGGKITIDKILSLNVQDENYDFKCTGYSVAGDKEGRAETLKELYALLSRIGAGDGQYVLDNIGERFNTIAELKEKIAFDNISIEGLLEKYADADRFSLCSAYGDVHIGEEQAAAALKEINGVMKKTAEEQYLLISAEERKSLPPFDRLYEEIYDECTAYRKKRAKLIKKYDGEAFFCDVFGTNKSKYKSPQQLWHIYHAVDFTQTCAYTLDKLKANKVVAPTDRQLDGLPALKEALISAKPAFCWHCTVSGQLSTVFTFELNQKTKAWLKARKDDYDFGTTQASYCLDDLAFYRGDEILFSSCTHERFHHDCTDE